ncbi:sulfotransferase 2A1 [Dermacentor silvarum]|uniref:sulfotransferase 2A1 n=1 Tax=Dermacentor silvarum TaxID=543639 RepID=UPI0018989D42|nr:sulfotransferase 2A1 [Dermacentor silvarum]
MDTDAYRDVGGVWMHKFFHEKNILASMKFSPSPDDVIIATFPKCGTKWMQYIVCSILTGGEPPSTPAEFMLASPYLEMMGVDAALRTPRPLSLMTHLPFDKLTFSGEAKYIYVARNPYDCCVSFYYFAKGLTPKTCEDVSFEKFLQMFLEGRTFYGDYFDHLISWYNRRWLNNLLFLTYEDLKRDTRSSVIRIADFLGPQHGQLLKRDNGLLEKVLKPCSLGNMKEVFGGKPRSGIKDILELPPEARIKSMEVYRETLSRREETHQGAGLIRKGIVGDWKNHFSQEQVNSMKVRIAEKTAGSDVMNLWKELDLP